MPKTPNTSPRHCYLRNIDAPGFGINTIDGQRINSNKSTGWLKNTSCAIGYDLARESSFDVFLLHFVNIDRISIGEQTGRWVCTSCSRSSMSLLTWKNQTWKSQDHQCPDETGFPALPSKQQVLAWVPFSGSGNYNSLCICACWYGFHNPSSLSNHSHDALSPILVPAAAVLLFPLPFDIFFWWEAASAPLELNTRRTSRVYPVNVLICCLVSRSTRYLRGVHAQHVMLMKWCVALYECKTSYVVELNWNWNLFLFRLRADSKPA